MLIRVTQRMMRSNKTTFYYLTATTSTPRVTLTTNSATIVDRRSAFASTGAARQRSRREERRKRIVQNTRTPSTLTFLLHGCLRGRLRFRQSTFELSDERPRVHASLLPDGQDPPHRSDHLAIAVQAGGEARAVIESSLFVHDAEEKPEALGGYSLDQRAGVAQDLGEGRAVNDGVFPFAVLYDIIGHVKEVEPVGRNSWKRKETGL